MHSLNLLPLEIANIKTIEPHTLTNDNNHVTHLLFKLFKRCRKTLGKISAHVKEIFSAICYYLVFESRNYFKEWMVCKRMILRIFEN